MAKHFLIPVAIYIFSIILLGHFLAGTFFSTAINDHDADYFFEGYAILHGLTPANTPHPGTPLQYLIAFMMLLVTDPFAKPNLIMTLTNTACGFVTITVLYYFWRTCLSRLRLRSAENLLVAALLICWPPFIYFSSSVSAESLSGSLSLLCAAIVWTICYKTRGASNATRWYWYLGLASGLMLSIKLTTLPIFAAALLACCVRDFSSRTAWLPNLLRVVSASAASFALLVLPSWRNIIGLIYTLLLHISGIAPAEMRYDSADPFPLSILDFAKIYIQANPLLGLLTAAVVLATAVSAALVLARHRTKAFAHGDIAFATFALATSGAILIGTKLTSNFHFAGMDLRNNAAIAATPVMALFVIRTAPTLFSIRAFPVSPRARQAIALLLLAMIVGWGVTNDLIQRVAIAATSDRHFHAVSEKLYIPAEKNGIVASSMLSRPDMFYAVGATVYTAGLFAPDVMRLNDPKLKYISITGFLVSQMEHKARDKIVSRARAYFSDPFWAKLRARDDVVMSLVPPDQRLVRVVLKSTDYASLPPEEQLKLFNMLNARIGVHPYPASVDHDMFMVWDLPKPHD